VPTEEQLIATDALMLREDVLQHRPSRLADVENVQGRSGIVWICERRVRTTSDGTPDVLQPASHGQLNRVERNGHRPGM